MQQQQPGTVTHSRISSLLISGRLAKPRVASRFSVRTSSVTKSGRGNPKIFGRASRASGWTPLSKFLNPPLMRKGWTVHQHILSNIPCNLQWSRNRGVPPNTPTGGAWPPNNQAPCYSILYHADSGWKQCNLSPQDKHFVANAIK